MAPETMIRTAAADGMTERFDPIECLDERVRHQASRYVEIQGPAQSLLIPLGKDAIHIGRGLAADLRLDESSVSRRHAILVPRPAGARILDDRSSNGTFVNGRRVQQADLRNGDVLVIGRVVLRYLEI